MACIICNWSYACHHIPACMWLLQTYNIVGACILPLQKINYLLPSVPLTAINTLAKQNYCEALHICNTKSLLADTRVEFQNSKWIAILVLANHTLKCSYTMPCISIWAFVTITLNVSLAVKAVNKREYSYFLPWPLYAHPRLIHSVASLCANKECYIVCHSFSSQIHESPEAETPAVYHCSCSVGGAIWWSVYSSTVAAYGCDDERGSFNHTVTWGAFVLPWGKAWWKSRTEAEHHSNWPLGMPQRPSDVNINQQWTSGYFRFSLWSHWLPTTNPRVYDCSTLPTGWHQQQHIYSSLPQSLCCYGNRYQPPNESEHSLLWFCSLG